LALAPHLAILPRAIQKNLAVTDDHAEQIVKIMGDTTRELADRLHLLGLAQLPLQKPPLADINYERYRFDVALFRCESDNTYEHADTAAILTNEFFLPGRGNPRQTELPNRPLVDFVILGRGHRVPTQFAQKQFLASVPQQFQECIISVDEFSI